MQYNQQLLISNKDSKGVQVKFLTRSQAGKSLLVDTCKILAAKVQSNKLKATEINQNLIDRNILGNIYKASK